MLDTIYTVVYIEQKYTFEIEIAEESKETVSPAYLTYGLTEYKEKRYYLSTKIVN